MKKEQHKADRNWNESVQFRVWYTTCFSHLQDTVHSFLNTSGGRFVFLSGKCRATGKTMEKHFERLLEQLLKNHSKKILENMSSNHIGEGVGLKLVTIGSWLAVILGSVVVVSLQISLSRTEGWSTWLTLLGETELATSSRHRITWNKKLLIY